MNLDVTGQRYGDLVALYRSDRSTSRMSYWICQCDCGNRTEVQLGSIRSGHTTSCGCLKGKTHGLRNTPEYAAWANMKQRCQNDANPGYPHYGGRGIYVCERWNESFENFLADMGPRPTASHSIERKDVNDHYTPENCEWATPIVQSRNRRNAVRHIVNGISLSEGDIEQLYGVSPQTLRSRMAKGMTLKEAVMTPVRPKRKTRLKE